MKLEEFLGQEVVVDLRSTFVCLGTLVSTNEHQLVLSAADLHDFRDSPTNRENYVVESKLTGIKRNRKEVVVNAREVVAVSRLADVLVD